MAERVYLEARKRNPARFDTYHAYERPLPVSGIEASRKEVCIVGRTNQRRYCSITERQLCFPTVVLQNASTGRKLDVTRPYTAERAIQGGKVNI